MQKKKMDLKRFEYMPCAEHCAKSLLYDSVYLCINLKNTQNKNCVLYLKYATAHIRESASVKYVTVYISTPSKYTVYSVFLRVYVPVSYTTAFHKIPLFT